MPWPPVTPRGTSPRRRLGTAQVRRGERGGEVPGMGSRGWGPAEAARPRTSRRPGAFSTGGRTAPGPGLRPRLAPQPPGLGGREGRLEPGRPPGRGGSREERAGRGAESIPPQPPVLSAQVDGGGAGRAVLKGTRWWKTPPEGGCSGTFASSPPMCPIEPKSRVVVFPPERHRGCSLLCIGAWLRTTITFG